MEPTARADVIVVGSGIAGLSAAVSALEHGASVILLERAPESERGGNTRYTESFWRLKSLDEVSDDLADRLAANAGGHPDPALVAETAGPYSQWSALARSAPFVDAEVINMMVEGAPEAASWLAGMGVRFDFLPSYFIAQSTTRMAPVGGGLALLEALIARAERFGAKLSTRFETTATGLMFDGGSVSGVEAVNGAHEAVQFSAPNVVLASGGFEGNPEMLVRYIGREATYSRPVARGGQWNRGEGVRMALDAGAAPCGDFGSFHAQPIDPRSPEPEAVMLAYHLGVLVNTGARRFTDEGAAMIDAVYEETTRQIMRQPEGLAYAIVDAKIDDVPNWRIAVRSRVEPVSADSIEGLALRLGLHAETLADSIDAYNDACDADLQPAFNAFTTDGVAASAASPPKSNWARPINTPPYRAWPIMAANCFTFGGVKIDPDARVVNMDGVPVPGLYAAGEVAGMYYRVYTGSTSVMRGAVTGRRAGSHAASRCAK